MQGSLGSVTVRSGAGAGVACGVGYQEHGATSAGRLLLGRLPLGVWGEEGLVWVGYDVRGVRTVSVIVVLETGEAQGLVVSSAV